MGLTLFVFLRISHLSGWKFINQVFSHSWSLLRFSCIFLTTDSGIQQTVIFKQFDLWCYTVWHIIDVCECVLARCIYVLATVVNLSKIDHRCSPNLSLIWFVPLWMIPASSSWTDLKRKKWHPARQHVHFVIYINDLPEDIESTTMIFADDTKIFREVTNHTAEWLGLCHSVHSATHYFSTCWCKPCHSDSLNSELSGQKFHNINMPGNIRLGVCQMIELTYSGFKFRQTLQKI